MSEKYIQLRFQWLKPPKFRKFGQQGYDKAKKKADIKTGLDINFFPID